MAKLSLYACFENHLCDLEIVDETEGAFIVQVLENYLIELSGEGFHFFREGEDTYRELHDEVLDMLRKKTYGYVSINEYRESLRINGQHP